MATGTAFAALLILAMLPAAIVKSFGAVSRKRLARFATRQRLEITPDNGNRVIVYLATVRRWRGAGLLIGVVCSVLWSSRQGRLSIGSVYLLSGWFAGAVIAEWRITRLVASGNRAASLQPRQPTDYVSSTARWLPVVIAGAAIVSAISAFTPQVAHPHAPRTSSVVLAALAVALAAASRAVERRIIERAQPLTAHDELAADDAIRSRSLHAVFGASTALAGDCLASQWQRISGSTQVADSIDTVATFGAILAAVIGWQIAVSRWTVRRTPLALPEPEPAAK